MRIDAAQNLAQSRADIAGRAGNENVFHYSLQSNRTAMHIARLMRILALLPGPVDAPPASRGLRCRTIWQ
jgi:hypothetical protein